MDVNIKCFSHRYWVHIKSSIEYLAECSLYLQSTEGKVYVL